MELGTSRLVKIILGLVLCLCAFFLLKSFFSFDIEINYVKLFIGLFIALALGSLFMTTMAKSAGSDL